MSGEQHHELYDRRRGRNASVAWIVAALAALMFAVTIVKLQECATSPFYEFFNPTVCDDVGAGLTEGERP